MLKNYVPTSDINVLKDSTSSVFEQAAKAQTGVYILDHNVPCGVVMSVDDYEKMVGENERMLDEITELKATIRLNNAVPELVSDHQVRGEKALREPVIDEDDGLITLKEARIRLTDYQRIEDYLSNNINLDDIYNEAKEELHKQAIVYINNRLTDTDLNISVNFE